MASRPTLEDLVAFVLANNQLYFAALAFVAYDWIINLDNEIRCFWSFPIRRKLNAAALLYGLSRYSTIVVQILQVQAEFLTSDTACQNNAYIQMIMDGFQTLSMATFSAIRIYALSPGSKLIAISTFLLLFVPGFIMLVVNGLGKITALPDPFNCQVSSNPLSEEVGDRVVIVGRVANIVGDILVLLVTWRETYRSHRVQQKLLPGSSLMRVMLYNGSTYFIIITIKNIAEAIVQSVGSFKMYIIYSVTSMFSAPINMYLTCHFLLDLHQANGASTLSSESTSPTLNFAAPNSRQSTHETLPAFIASMGSRLSYMSESGLDDPEDVAQKDKEMWIFHHEVLSERDDESELDIIDIFAGRDESV